jgi:hypothetical protein
MMVYKTLKVAAILVLAYTLLAGLVVIAVVFRVMAIDFPCFAYYDEQNRCVSASPYLWGEASRASQIEVLLTAGGVGIGGGGCHRQESQTDLLELNTTGITLKLKAVDDALQVNGAVVGKGETFQARRIFYLLNPWLASEVSFKNLGRVTLCDARDAPPQVVAVGNSSVHFSWQTGLLLLCAGSGAFVLAHRKSSPGSRK